MATSRKSQSLEAWTDPIFQGPNAGGTKEIRGVEIIGVKENLWAQINLINFLTFHPQK